MSDSAPRSQTSATRRRLATVGVALLALVALSSCSGSSSDAAPSTTAKPSTTTEATTTTNAAAARVDVTEWAEGFCADFGMWIDAIGTAGSTVADGVPKGDVAAAKAALVKLFATSADDTDTLIAALDDGGIPDLTDGTALVEDLKAKFVAFKQAIVAAQGDAAALPTDDPKAFATQVDGLVATFRAETTKVGDSFAEIDTKYPSAEVQKALGTSCGT